MSATNRGGERNPFDYYPTKYWCVDSLLAHFPLPGRRLLEPSAGDGAIVRAINRSQPDIDWTLVEIDSAHTGSLSRSAATSTIHCPQDFLTWRTNQWFDMVIGNPPFTLAQQFVDKSLKLSYVVALLLRLMILGSDDRYEWWKSLPPCDIKVLTPRAYPDSTEYAWFIWHPNATNSWDIIHKNDGAGGEQLNLF